MLKPLHDLLEGRNLDDAGVQIALAQLISAPEAAVSAAILTAWAIKGETGAELAAAVAIIMPRAIPLPIAGQFIDTCGTGGDGLGTFNISTATAIVVAACGVRVVKHGNRAVSSQSGSADALTHLGIATDIPVHLLAEGLDRVGVVFCLATRHHPALAGLGALRKQLGFRSLFNALGPLLNPAQTGRQVIGAGQPRWLDSIAQAAAILDREKVCVVRGEDGLDEVTLDGDTHLRIVECGTVRSMVLSPSVWGLGRVETGALRARSPEESAKRIVNMLQGKDAPAEQVVRANAALALWTAGIDDDFRSCAERARQAVSGGSALAVLENWRTWTRDVSGFYKKTES